MEYLMLSGPVVQVFPLLSTSPSGLQRLQLPHLRNRKRGMFFSRSLTSQEHFNLTATMSSFSEKELICPQCTDIYCFPVLLKCGHNICRVCLQKFWEWKGSRECPVCQIVSVLGRPPINLELKLAADEYQQHNTSGDEEICLLHKKRLTIFCQNDEEAICLVCQSSKKHKVHECYPVEEAAQQKKVSKNRNCKITCVHYTGNTVYIYL